MKRGLWIALLAAGLLAVAFRTGYRAGQRETVAETVVRVDTVVLERPAPDTVWRERTVVRWLARAESNPRRIADRVDEPTTAAVSSAPTGTMGVARTSDTTGAAGPAATGGPAGTTRLAGTNGRMRTPNGDLDASQATQPLHPDTALPVGPASLAHTAMHRQTPTAVLPPGGRPALCPSTRSAIHRALRPATLPCSRAFRPGQPAAGIAGGDSVPVEVPIDRYLFTDSTYRAEVTGYDVRLERMEVYPRTVVRTIRREPSRWGVSIGIGVGVTPSGRVEPALQLHVGWRLFPLGRSRER